MPRSSNEIVVSRSLIWELEKEGETNPSSVRLGDRTFQITGIYEQLPFEPLYTREQISRANQYHRFTFLSVPEKPITGLLILNVCPVRSKMCGKVS